MRKEQFEVPQNCTYLAGMSLGCLSRRSRAILAEELDVWSTLGVDGHSPQHHPHQRSWYHVLERVCNEKIAKLVGANTEEVAVMGELSANLNMLFVQFYNPKHTGDRYKIVMEKGPFPSDQFLVEGHVIRCGFRPEDAIIYVEPTEEDGIIDEQAIYDLLKKDPKIHTIFLGAVNYYTGQLFNIDLITRWAHQHQVIMAVDLAHAIGNVPLKMHDWQVDFAAWCSYKYVNSGPGGIAGIFVHQRWLDEQPVFRGWWGSERQFGDQFVPLQGAQRYVQSNPSALCLSTLLGSLEVFDKTTMVDVRRESHRLCMLFRQLCKDLIESGALSILTPIEYERSGAQLTLLFPKHNHDRVFQQLRDMLIITDTRHHSIRVAFVALYNDAADVARLSACLHNILA